MLSVIEAFVLVLLPSFILDFSYLNLLCKFEAPTSFFSSIICLAFCIYWNHKVSLLLLQTLVVHNHYFFNSVISFVLSLTNSLKIVPLGSWLFNSNDYEGLGLLPCSSITFRCFSLWSPIVFICFSKAFFRENNKLSFIVL